ncbi:hypothetical protein LG329_04515 [Virgibacillus necropolis]|uniref:hypothetical protein n=1 Tax=Virgibacillus necropolis TaxID=163877 RepID=UPI00384F8379
MKNKSVWEKINRVAISLIVLDFIILIVYVNTVGGMDSTFIKFLMVILFICFTFGVFDRVRSQITKGVNVKTFLYTLLIIGAMYLFATYVVV